MNKLIYHFYVIFCFSACSDKTTIGYYPVIDVVNSVGEYKRVYCSDYFSSLELIPLETSDDCLLAYNGHVLLFDLKMILMNEEYIFIRSRNDLYTFDHSGKFLNQIGRQGQGPREYTRLSDIFFNTDKPTIFMSDDTKILEYDFNGTYIRSFPYPIIDNEYVTFCSSIADNLFIGHINNSSGKQKYRYCIFNENGVTVKLFHNHNVFDRISFRFLNYDAALQPIHVEDHIYLKDYVNDTIYVLENLTMKPAFVYGLGKYSFPQEYLEKKFNDWPDVKAIIIRRLIGTQAHFFYVMTIPDFLPRPKRKLKYIPSLNKKISDEELVLGIYNISDNTNVLLDTDNELQRGIINDFNGGLPFFPRYYAGNNIVVDVWEAEEMKEILSEEYFAKQNIKDRQAHQKLKELLKNLKEDDNPVVVVAKLK